MGVKELLSKAKKSKIVKEAKKGHDFGKKNGPHTGFKAVEEEAEEEGKSKSSAKKIAASAFWKKIGKR